MILDVTMDLMKHRNKSDLPTRDCVVCGKPFVWRKKWAAVWDEVRYCSERCRRARSFAPSSPVAKDPSSVSGMPR
jgi:hypothetical protein